MARGWTPSVVPHPRRKKSIDSFTEPRQFALQKCHKLVKHGDRVERIGKLQKYPQYHCGMDAVKFALERCEGIFTNIFWLG